MVRATEAAMTALESLDPPPGAVLRLERDPSPESMVELTVGPAKSGDDVLEHDGLDVLHVPAELSAALSRSVLDLVVTESGPRLTLDPDPDVHEDRPAST